MRYFQVELLFCDPSCQSDSLSLSAAWPVSCCSRCCAPQTGVGPGDRSSVSVVCTQEFASLLARECASKAYPVAIVTIGLLLKYLSEERRKNSFFFLFFFFPLHSIHINIYIFNTCKIYSYFIFEPVCYQD